MQIASFFFAAFGFARKIVLLLTVCKSVVKNQVLCRVILKHKMIHSCHLDFFELSLGQVRYKSVLLISVCVNIFVAFWHFWSLLKAFSIVFR